MKGVLLMVSLFGSLVGCSASQVTQTEHGWKTERVVATRYQGSVGYNIGFKFPEDPYNCDRAEISDFIEAHGGNIFQGGGYPGAESFAVFDGVTDKESADRKIKEMLPALDKLMVDMAAGKKIAPSKPKETPLTMTQWIEKMNTQKKPAIGKDGEWLGGGSNGYNSWTMRNVKGVLVYEDTTERSLKAMADEQSRKDSLADALVSRCLTDEELKLVGQYGSQLLTRPMQPYNQQDIESRFQSMMSVQAAFRAGKCSHHE